MEILSKNNLNGWALPEEAFSWIRENFPNGSTIVELGSGRGTIELCRFYNMYSIEQDEKWLNLANSNYIHAPLKDYMNNLPGTTGWYDDRLFNSLPDHYDLLIIDGPVGINRINILNFIDRFKTEIPILIDDTHRAPDRKMALQLSAMLQRQYMEVKGHQKKFIILK